MTSPGTESSYPRSPQSLKHSKSESTAGLTFVCLSRAKRLVDLLIEPMPLEKLSEIGDTPTFQLRLRKEVRLNNLAGETLRLHGSVE